MLLIHHVYVIVYYALRCLSPGWLHEVGICPTSTSTWFKDQDDWSWSQTLSLSYTMYISLQSTIKLRSGAVIPQLGYGVYQARGEDCEKGVAEALRVGYTHIDSAQAYRNEKCTTSDWFIEPS